MPKPKPLHAELMSAIREERLDNLSLEGGSPADFARCYSALKADWNPNTETPVSAKWFKKVTLARLTTSIPVK